MSPLTQLLQIGLPTKYKQITAWVLVDNGEEKKGLLPMGINFLKEFTGDLEDVTFIDHEDILKSYKDIHAAMQEEHPKFAKGATFYMAAKRRGVWALGTGKNQLVRRRAASTALALTIAGNEIQAKRMDFGEMEDIINNHPDMHNFCVIAGLLESEQPDREQPDRKKRRKDSSRSTPADPRSTAAEASGSQPDLSREVTMHVLDTKAFVSDKTVDIMVNVNVEGYGDVRLGAILPA